MASVVPCVVVFSTHHVEELGLGGSSVDAIRLQIDTAGWRWGMKMKMVIEIER